jgi:ornithine cyclodeaminase
MNIVILNQRDVVDMLPMAECIRLMAEALTALARGKVYMPLRITVGPQDAKGIMALMPAYMSGEQAAYSLKAICVFPNNPTLGKDAHQGSVLLYSAETGELQAMINASAVTAIRTAAVSAVATRLLARKNAEDLAIIGAGVQGRHHLAAMAAVRPIKRVRIADQIFEKAQKLEAEMSGNYPYSIKAVENTEAAVRDADIIVTVTNSSEPVLKRDWIAAGTHLNVVGACVPHAREVDTATMAESRLYVDSRESTFHEAGDYIIASREGAIGPNHVQAEIGELLIGKAAGRSSDQEITLFKALGLAVEDLAVARYLYRQAQEKQTGTWLQF